MTSHLARYLDAYEYFPSAGARLLEVSLGGAVPHAMLVQRSTVIDEEAVRRHVNAIALTRRHLVLMHIDEIDDAPGSLAISSEIVPLSNIVATRFTYEVSDAVNGSGEIREVLISLGWKSTRQFEFGPKSCGDPTCEAEHGQGGVIHNEDLAIRVTAEADGKQELANALEFGAELARLMATAE
ncbi:MAG: DUF5998 family protein [Buchananella hordeovulneris]|nr:DUF5998 family protein [Buchananella hordeovulneris]